MQRNISRLTTATYDLLIIGGGINGCAIANLAASAGASVALIEKGDFASGTSSKSTKLLHGGIRYLENLEFDLVAESLKERYIQWQAAPHLVKPMPFIIPVYQGDARPLWMMQLGVFLYDFLSGKYRVGQHRRLSYEDVTTAAPSINRKGLLGAVEYFDTQMDDARITLENALMADAKGACVANYVEARELIKQRDKVVGVKAQDVLTGQALDIYAATVISTVGPWSNEMRQMDVPRSLPRLRLTKGVHIVYQGQIAPQAFLIQAKDRRIFFVIPFKSNTLIGTTDTDYDGNPDNVKVEEEDLQYLLREASRVFPSISFDSRKIIATFAGLRPLVFDKGTPGKISRKHAIEQTSSGLWYVLGGKFTTYRAMAQETIEKAMPQLKGKLPFSGQWTLYGSGAVSEEIKLISQRYNVSFELVRHLMSVYGSRYTDLLELIKTFPELNGPICTCSPTVKAQIVYAKQMEMAVRWEDIFERRLQLQYNHCVSKACLKSVRGHTP